MRILTNEEVVKLKKDLVTLASEQFNKDEMNAITDMFELMQKYLKSRDISFTLIGEASDRENLK